MENTSSPISASCIFCKIVKGELPLHKVYEDETFLAFLDIHPQSPGHTLIIPKKHYRFVWDVENIGDYFSVVQKIAKAVQKASGTDEVFMKVIGEEVPHAHVWVFANPEKANGDKNDFTTNLATLRANLK